MSQDITDLSPEQHQAIELLISGRTIGDIAAELGVHRRTLWRWRQMPLFQSAYRHCLSVRREVMRDTVDSIIEKSLQALLKEAESLEYSNAQRLERAVTILKLFKSAQHPMIREEPMNTYEDED